MAFEEDYIVRQIQALSAMVTRAATFGHAGKVAQGVEEAAHAWDELGVPPELLDRVDAATLLMMLGANADKQRAAIELLAVEADLRDRDTPGAGASRRALGEALRALVER